MKRDTMKTNRINISFLREGREDAPKLLLIHGNASSSVFYEGLMRELSDDFCMIAPDLRCFGESEAKAIVATRGLRDFSDDLYALIKEEGWDQFAILGWSMGGGVAMQFAIDHPEMLTGLILEGPLSPFGFGGTKDASGTKLLPEGLASGGGCANSQLIKAIMEKDRDFIRTVLYSTYVKPTFSFDKETEDKLIDGILLTKIGDGMYPGDSVTCEEWPGLKSGEKGVNNTMSPAYCDLSGLADILNKVPVLWIRGDSDILVSDTSMGDFGYLGKLGMVPGWPGEVAIPPQPMIAQTRFVLEKYKENGGSYKEVVMQDAGHGCHLEYTKEFADEIRELLLKFTTPSSSFL